MSTKLLAESATSFDILLGHINLDILPTVQEMAAGQRYLNFFYSNGFYIEIREPKYFVGPTKTCTDLLFGKRNHNNSIFFKGVDSDLIIVTQKWT